MAERNPYQTSQSQTGNQPQTNRPGDPNQKRNNSSTDPANQQRQPGRSAGEVSNHKDEDFEDARRPGNQPQSSAPQRNAPDDRNSSGDCGCGEPQNAGADEDRDRNPEA